MAAEDMSEVEKSIEVLRKKVVDQITQESEQLIQVLLRIAFDDEEDSRVKLQAIGMLIDRCIPKLAVDSSKAEVIEETGARKRMREEIEALLKQKED